MDQSCSTGQAREREAYISRRCVSNTKDGEGGKERAEPVWIRADRWWVHDTPVVEYVAWSITVWSPARGGRDVSAGRDDAILGALEKIGLSIR